MFSKPGTSVKKHSRETIVGFEPFGFVVSNFASRYVAETLPG